MGNQASVAIEKGRAAAEDAVGRAVGPITKCMSRDASELTVRPGHQGPGALDPGTRGLKAKPKSNKN